MHTKDGRKCRQYYVATIQIVIDAPAESEASDGISEILNSASPYIVDWAYLRINGQFMYPTPHFLPDDLQEGEFQTTASADLII